MKNALRIAALLLAMAYRSTAESATEPEKAPAPKKAADDTHLPTVVRSLQPGWDLKLKDGFNEAGLPIEAKIHDIDINDVAVICGSYVAQATKADLHFFVTSLDIAHADASDNIFKPVNLDEVSSPIFLTSEKPASMAVTSAIANDGQTATLTIPDFQIPVEHI